MKLLKHGAVLLLAVIFQGQPVQAGFREIMIDMMGIDTYPDSQEYKNSGTCRTLWYTKKTTGRINLNWAGDIYLDEKRMVNNRNYNTSYEIWFARRENELFRNRAYKECRNLLSR